MAARIVWDKFKNIYAGEKLTFLDKIRARLDGRVAAHNYEATSDASSEPPREPSAGFLAKGLFEDISVDMVASGWVNVNDGAALAHVEVLVDGVLVAETEVGSSEACAPLDGSLNRNSTFRIRIPRSAINQLVSNVDIKVDGRVLRGSPRRLSLANGVTIAIASAKNGVLWVQGRGWNGGPITGQIVVDGRSAALLELTTLKNGIDREQRLVGGFWPIPAMLSDGQPHTYAFEIDGSREPAPIISESLFAAGVPAILKLYSGFYQFESDVAESGVWVSDRVVVPSMAVTGDVVFLKGTYFPDSIVKQTGSPEAQLVFFVNDAEVYTTTLASHGDFTVEFTLPKINTNNAGHSIEIQCSKAFVPEKIGQGEDDRKLAWRMKALVIGNAYIFDCVRTQNIATAEQCIRSDTKVIRYPDYKVYIDHADFRGISGCAARMDSAAPLHLEISCEGTVVGKAIALQDRSDVPESLWSSGTNCGFRVGFEKERNGSSTTYLIKDTLNGITVAEIFLANPFESLSHIAVDWARNSVSSRASLASVLAPTIFAASSRTMFSCQLLPKSNKTENASGVDIVIPVYGCFNATAECIDSVLAAKNRTNSRIIIVNDCTPDRRILDYLNLLIRLKRKDVIVIHRSNNGGFSESVNIGMIVSGERDVILLNADTVVQDGWVDRLAAAAASDLRIATVTPLTNNGEICSLPYLCKSLPVNTPELALKIDEIAKRLNAGKRVELPVAVGFCMYIRRKCIDEIGMFDAALWGRGYGEEVDFCLKAAANGWSHVLAGDIFVVHRGNASFGSEKLNRINESSQKIRERYPFYDSLIQRFVSTDPVSPIRRAINLELIASVIPKRRVLHITHAFGGGTEQYVNDMVSIYDAEGISSAILRFGLDGIATLSFDMSETDYTGFFFANHDEKYTPVEVIEQGGLLANLDRMGFERAHLHAPFGVPRNLLSWITTQFKFDVTVHDYAWICPRVSLTRPGGSYCGEPPVAQCSACISVYKAHPALQQLVKDTDGDVERYRTLLSDVLSRADIIFVGTHDVAERLKQNGVQGNFRVVPHPAPARSVFSTSNVVSLSRIHDGIVRIATIGNLSDIKGFHRLRECAELAQKKQLPMHFFIFGDTMDDGAMNSLSNVSVLGKYRDVDLEQMIVEYQPALAFFPNQWPETFSYTLSHCFRLGLWPLASDFGGPAERIRNAGFGSIFDRDLDAEGILRTMLDLALDLRMKTPTIAPIQYPGSLLAYTERCG